MATIPAYSKVLWELPAGYPIPGPQPGPGPGVGLVWVVRELQVANLPPAGWGHGIPRLILYANGLAVFGTPFNATYAGGMWEARDVRWVIANPGTLEINTDNANWSLRASGYELTA